MLKIKLIDSNKPDQFKDVDLIPETKPNQECFIGRLANCDLLLEAAEVSRMHGKVSMKRGNYYFADLASSGGSRINGEKAQINQDYLLNPGDKIQIGRFVLMISQMRTQEDKTFIESQQKAQQILVDRSGSQPVPSHISLEEFMPLAIVEPSQLQRWVKGELTVICIGVIDETHDVKTFRFVAQPPMLFTYKPGQFVTLKQEINGKQVSRSYTISSSPSRPHTLEITVKRVPRSLGESTLQEGLVSNWLHDHVTVGSRIHCNGPLGKFTCFTNPLPKMLFLSAGIGITPMMSMSRWLCDTASDCDIIFFHSVRTLRDFIFRQELELMSARHPNFRLVVSTTRKEPGQTWFGLTGRFDTAMLQVVAPDFRERSVYVCGPHGFMENVNQILQTFDYPMQNYHEESFGSPRKSSKFPISKQTVVSTLDDPVTPVVDYRFKQSFIHLPRETVSDSNVGRDAARFSNKSSVIFSQSRIEAYSDGEESILNLAEQQGVRIRNSCRSGVCGSCKKLKLQGQIYTEGEPEALEESERQQGYVLTCISYPIGRVVIDA
ncbi:FHA domain-containing protein [Scytonema tolypothrichoides VB-61278]|nr:FHA domain-containing protein [Scytonema tolypothrichoides VB-61278]